MEHQPRANITKVEDYKGVGIFLGRLLFFVMIFITSIIVYCLFSAESNKGAIHSSPLSSFLMFCGAIYGTFNLTESLLKKDVLSEVCSWMIGLQEKTATRSWINGFLKMFDTLFSVKIIKKTYIPSFLRSCLASFLFTLIMFGFMTFAGFEFFVFKLTMFPESWAYDGSWGAVIEALFFTLLLSVFFNVMPDYISMIETRLILQKLKRTSNIKGLMQLLVLDIIFTLVIAFIGSAIANVLFPIVSFIISGFELNELIEWNVHFNTEQLVQVYITILNPHEMIHYLDLKKSMDPAFYCAVFIYSTFLTSLWVWMFALSSTVIRISYKFNIVKNFLSKTYLISEKPLSVMGGVCISVFSVVFWGAYWVSIL